MFRSKARPAAEVADDLLRLGQTCLVRWRLSPPRQLTCMVFLSFAVNNEKLMVNPMICCQKTALSTAIRNWMHCLWESLWSRCGRGHALLCSSSLKPSMPLWGELWSGSIVLVILVVHMEFAQACCFIQVRSSCVRKQRCYGSGIGRNMM